MPLWSLNSSSRHTHCSAGEGHPGSALFFCCFFLGLCHTACDMLVPQPGIEPRPSTVRAWSPNHWTVKEFLAMSVQFSSVQSLSRVQLFAIP